MRRWHGVISSISRYHSIIFLLSLTITLFLWIDRGDQSDYPKVIPHGMRLAEKSDRRILAAQLIACDTTTGGGVGNVVFELIAFQEIARKLYRSPAIYSDSSTCLEKIATFVEHMPHLVDGFLIVKRPRFIPYPSKYPAHECFDYFDPISTFQSVQHHRIVNTQFNYLQNVRFIDELMGSAELQRRLAFSNQLLDVAKSSVYPEKIDEQTHNICVHVRRGDFMKEKFHLESEADFTVDATKYLIRKMHKRGISQVRVFILGQDAAWARQIFAKASLRRKINLTVIHSPSYLPSMIDWAFAKLYCDTTLLTDRVPTSPTHTEGLSTFFTQF
ncbi:unnamed protein product, partial [Mesorhabditis belari]|uniref:L-Fucosyltransferase n=1 Tax=Mesorhabditis belari TaxID=2138241 RepID=A0AAF3F9W4_9BILA